MMTMIAILTFGSALGLSAGVLAMTVGPRMGQIMDILFAGSRQAQPVPVLAGRRVAVRRREVSTPRGSYRPREAA